MLETHGLTVGYGDLHLFRNLDLSLFAGELVCFMGPNGAGKSTLIRTLGGLQRPLSGAISYREENQKTSSSPESKRIALVLTDPVKEINMTVLEIVTFGRYPYLDWNIRLQKQDQDIVNNSLTQVNIEYLKEKKLHQLSDGQLQMVMIARALAQDTPIIILDEPTAHLDLNNRVEIMKLLRTLAKEMGKAILLATHELDLALQTADLIWLTGKQKDIIKGMPEDLVLDGSFDKVFEFKGFDLKTGKVQHKPFRDFTIQLEGEGYRFLWTKNALERNGFKVVDYSTSNQVRINTTEEMVNWTINDSPAFTALSDLLNYLFILSDKK